MKKNSKGMTRRGFMKTVASPPVPSGSAPGCLSLSGLRLRQPKTTSSSAGLASDRSGAAFTQSSPWLDNRAIDAMNKDAASSSKRRQETAVKVKIVDTESNPTKAAELASKLIMMDKVDIMYVSATPATVSPVAGVCESRSSLLSAP